MSTPLAASARPHSSLTPLGAVETVTGSKYVVEHAGRRVLVDAPAEFARMQEFHSYLASTVHVAHAHRPRASRWRTSARSRGWPISRPRSFTNSRRSWGSPRATSTCARTRRGSSSAPTPNGDDSAPSTPATTASRDRVTRCTRRSRRPSTGWTTSSRTTTDARTPAGRSPRRARRGGHRRGRRRIARAAAARQVDHAHDLSTVAPRHAGEGRRPDGQRRRGLGGPGRDHGGDAAGCGLRGGRCQRAAVPVRVHVRQEPRDRRRRAE